MTCYRKGGCGPYEMRPCNECPASRPDYAKRYDTPETSARNALDVEEARRALLASFEGSFINDRDEFIAHPRTNQYFLLGDCKTPEDIEAKVIEWLSRPAHKTAPYSQEWRNRKLHEFIRNGINAFLDTHFTEEDMAVIYQHLGNAIRHGLTMEFIRHDMDVAWLKEAAE